MSDSFVLKSQQILGVSFFLGSPREAVHYISRAHGYVVVPAAPAMVRLRYDQDFRTALCQADVAIADSGFMVLLWKLIGGGSIPRVSGLAYLKRLLDLPEIRAANQTFWILPSKSAVDKARRWLNSCRFQSDAGAFYVAPRYSGTVEDERLLKIIDQRRPQHIIIGIGGGPQEKLGRYLKMCCSFQPAIHCVGAALGFLTGDQIAIPDWADRLFLGWLFRLIAQPRIFVPRLWSARKLPWLIWKYRDRLPPLEEK